MYTVKTYLIIKTATVFLLLIFFVSCGNSSSKIDSYSDSIDGTYSYKDSSAEITITVSGNLWTGKTIFSTGLGLEYDNQNAQYDNGVVNGKDLYESTGTVKIGSISGKLIYTNVGGQSITLRKKL